MTLQGFEESWAVEGGITPFQLINLKMKIKNKKRKTKPFKESSFQRYPNPEKKKERNLLIKRFCSWNWRT
jgi:hypothetical protein